MEPGTYAYNSYHTLLKSGYPLERLDAAGIKKRFPSWHENVYNDGYYNSKAGISYDLTKTLFYKDGQKVVALLANGLKKRKAKESNLLQDK